MAMFSPRRVIRKSMANDTACPMTVAQAAPLTPILQVKMRNGSSRTFSTAPVTIPYMARLAFPCRRIWLFSVREEVRKGAPRRMMRI